MVNRLRVTTRIADRYIAVVVKWNRRAISAGVTCVEVTAIHKKIYSTAVRRMLYLNELYARVLQVCVPLSVKSREVRLN